MQQLHDIFDALDSDGSGSIELEEFTRWTENDKARAFFERTLCIDVFRAEQTFRILDFDGTGTLEKEEFVVGCLRLSGNTKAIDQAMNMRSMKRVQQGIESVKRGISRLDLQFKQISRPLPSCIRNSEGAMISQ